MSTLVLLDVNGLLCFKDDTKSMSESIKCDPKYHIVLRPGIFDFLKVLSQEFTVGIFSSTTFGNLEKILKAIDPSWKRWIAVVADRTVTSLDPEFGSNEKITSYDTVKD